VDAVNLVTSGRRCMNLAVGTIQSPRRWKVWAQVASWATAADVRSAMEAEKAHPQISNSRNAFSPRVLAQSLRTGHATCSEHCRPSQYI